MKGLINSSAPSTAYMRQWIGSALVQIMPCRLYNAKSLAKPMLDYCQVDNNFSVIVHLKISSAKWWPLCPGGDELTISQHWFSKKFRYVIGLIQNDIGDTTYCCCCCIAYAQIVRVAHSWVRSSCWLDGFFSRFSTLIISSEISLSLPASSLNTSSYFNFVTLFPTFWQVWRICCWVYHPLIHKFNAISEWAEQRNDPAIVTSNGRPWTQFSILHETRSFLY